MNEALDDFRHVKRRDFRSMVSILRDQLNTTPDDSAALLFESIRLQTLLIQSRLENVQHRCWRAMMYREADQLDAALAAVDNAKTDLDSIDLQFADHPPVVRTREAVRRLDDTKRETQ